MIRKAIYLLFSISFGLALVTLFLLCIQPAAAQPAVAPSTRFLSSNNAEEAVTSLPAGWAYQCANCPLALAQTNNRNLRIDNQGRPHVAFGMYKMYYGVFVDGSWQFEVVDDNTPRGEYASLALDAAGNPHVSYRTHFGKDVYYAYKDATGWHRELVDNSNTDVYDDGGYTSIEIDPQGRPHILFRGYVDDSLQPFIHAYRDGSGWHQETVDDGGNLGFMNSLVIDADGYLYTTYVDQTNSDGDLSRLLYAYQDASGWQHAVVEDAINDTNANGWGGSSLALTSSGQPVVAYHYRALDETTSIRLARRQSDGSWVKEDPYVGSIGWWFPALLLDANNYPHIMHAGHYEGYWQTLFHTYQDNTGWHFDVVDPMNWNADSMSIAQDADGNIYALYKIADNNTTDAVRADNVALATRAISSGLWITDTIAPHGSAGDFSTLILDADDHPHIASQDGGRSEDVRYTFWDGTTWNAELAALDARGELNLYAISSLALDSAENPHIAYINKNQGWMAYGYRDQNGWQYERIPGVYRTYFVLGMRPDGYPSIALADGPLGFAYKDGLGWHSETLTTTQAGDLSMQLDTLGLAHVSFNAGGKALGASSLWYAYQDGAKIWHFENVNTPNTVNTTYGITSLALDAAGHPYIAHVSYPESGNYQVVVSYKNGGSWQSVVVENDTGGSPSLAIDSLGYPHVTYLNEQYGDYPEYKYNLRYAYQDDLGWHYATLDIIKMIAPHPDIALDSQDRAYISYADYNCLAVVSKTAPIDVDPPTLPNAPGSDSPLITPTDGLILDTPRPYFDWTDGSDDTGVVSYTLVITGESGLGALSQPNQVYQVTTSESYYTPDWDLPNGTYRWTVRAFDAAGNASPWAASQSFSVKYFTKTFIPLVVRAP